MNKQGENGIPYCDYTWNPVTGCLHGCSYCFAERIAKRFNGSKAFPRGFEPTFHASRLLEVEKIKKPSRIFVSDMGDLFGDWVPSEWIENVLDVIKDYPQHTFLFLTKNPKRYREFEFPENAEIGTSVEDQAAADERIPLLLQASATVRFISAEPLLGEINVSRYLKLPICKHWSKDGNPDDYGKYHWEKQSLVSAGWTGLKWVICGGESGPGAHPMHPNWVRSLRDQCQAAGTKFFFKQWGEYISCQQDEWTGVTECEEAECKKDTASCFIRVGKKKAGRELDSRTWDEMPCPTKR